jgi:hypothetical protein
MVFVIPNADPGNELGTYDAIVAAAEAILGREVATGAMTMLTADLNNKLRVREMIQTQDMATNILPADFLEVDTLVMGDVRYFPAAERGNAPRTYAVKNGVLVFNPVETAPEYALSYYAKLLTLSAGTTNDVLIKYPDVYLYGVLLHHSRLVRDESGAAAWGPSFFDAITSAQQNDVASRNADAPLRVMPRASA